jgi:hypothetical protein
MKSLYGFEIGSTNYERIYIIHANTELEMKSWMDALYKNIEYLARVVEEQQIQPNNELQLTQKQKLKQKCKIKKKIKNTFKFLKYFYNICYLFLLFNVHIHVCFFVYFLFSLLASELSLEFESTDEFYRRTGNIYIIKKIY